jgi:hypothetical protein
MNFRNENRIRVDPEFKSELEKALADYKKNFGGRTSMQEFTRYLVSRKNDYSKGGSSNNAKREPFDFRL